MQKERGEKEKVSKKDKKRKRKDEEKEGRRSTTPKRKEEDLEVGQKSLEVIFKDTGMDPDGKRRMKVLKKARKLGKKEKRNKKKRDKGSSHSHSSTSTSTASSSSVDMGEEGLFEEEKRLRSIWRKCPGALSARSIQEIKRNLVTAAGTTWETDRTSLPPLYTQYGRQVIMPTMSAALQQETLTLCQGLDLLARGHVACAMDLLNQRLKSVEALGKGSHWSLCRQYELVRVEEGGMTEEPERIAAARRAKEEERLKGLMMRAPTGGKGNDPSQSGKTRKGKDKGGSKGQSGDASKGKGGGNPKEEGNKGSWQKK